MIQGTVNSRREAVVRLQVRGPGGTVATMDAIIDSGITSSLTLPTATVAALGLVRHSGGTGILADGSVRPLDIYTAEVEWGRTWRPVLVYAVGNEALLGMGLLANHKVVIEVVAGGSVEIVPLP